MKYIFLTFLLSISVFCQEKPQYFFLENGEEISRSDFIRGLDSRRFMPFYYEADTMQYAILAKQRKFGKLTESQLLRLKQYLTKISSVKIDSTKNIVIDYLTTFPSSNKYSRYKSEWDILRRSYLKKLSRIAPIFHFYINSINCSKYDIETHQLGRMKWLPDNKKILKQMFHNYEPVNSSFILVKPDGKYFYYLGEYRPEIVYEHCEKFFTTNHE